MKKPREWSGPVRFLIRGSNKNVTARPLQNRYRLLLLDRPSDSPESLARETDCNISSLLFSGPTFQRTFVGHLSDNLKRSRPTFRAVISVNRVSRFRDQRTVDLRGIPRVAACPRFFGHLSAVPSKSVGQCPTFVRHLADYFSRAVATDKPQSLALMLPRDRDFNGE